MKRLNRQNTKLWLMVVGTATLILGAAYGLVQQSTRLGANDGPHRLADTTRESLNSGVAASKLMPGYAVHAPKDSSIFVTVTDKNGAILSTNLVIDGTENMDLPMRPPVGVLQYAAVHGSDSVTWQPFTGVRLASYTEPYNNGYVVTGQSLKPFEDRANTYLAIAATAWLAVVIWVTLLCLL